MSTDARKAGGGGELAAADVRRLLRALHALHDEQIPLADRLNILARDLAVLTGARQCVIGEVDANGGSWPLRLTARGVFADLTEDDLRRVMACFDDAEAPDVLAQRVLAEPVNGGAVTLSAHRTIGRERWRSGRLCARYLMPAGLDDLLHSRSEVELRERCFGWIGLGRPSDGPGFAEREAAIVNMLHAEVGPWLWARIAGLENGTPAEPPTNQVYRMLLRRLTPAQARVFPLLVRGLKEEAIGAEINRSRHTVHDHARSIYAAAGVRSRLELILLIAGGDSEGTNRSGAEEQT